MAIIEPNRKYSISEVVGLRLIKGIDDYYALYKLIVKMEVIKDETTKYGKRDWSNIFGETTKTTLKAEEVKFKPWSRVRRLRVKGSEILKFLRINEMI